MASLAELLSRRKLAESSRNATLATTLNAGTASSLGAMGGKLVAREGDVRSKLLQKLLTEGKLQPGALGAYDKSIVGAKYWAGYQAHKASGSSSFLSGVPGLGLVGKGLSEGYKFATGLPEGIFNFGKSVGSDAIHNLENPLQPTFSNPFSLQGLKETAPETTKNVIEPTLQYYKGKYFTGSPGEILSRAVNEPFSTALDVGSAFSMGAGTAGRVGGIASKLGEAGEAATAGEGVLGGLASGTRAAGNYLGKFGYKGTRGIRPDLELPGGATLAREYGNSPMVRAAQKLTDKYLDTVPPVATLRAKLAQHGIINTLVGRSRIQSAYQAANESRSFIKAAKDLTPDEATAFTLLKNGINMQYARGAGGVQRGALSMFDAYKQVIESSVKGDLPDHYNIQNFKGLNVDPKVAEALLQKLNDPQFRQIIENPENYPKLVAASKVWDDQVDKTLTSHGIDMEEHQQRVYAPQEAVRLGPKKLRQLIEDTGGKDLAQKVHAVKDPAGAFEKFSAQHAAEFGEEFPVKPNYIPHEIAEGTYKDLTKIKRSPYVATAKRAEDIVKERHPSFLNENDLSAFLSGAAEVGTQPITRFIHRREAALAHNGAVGKLVNQLAARDAHGDVLKVKDPSELQQVLRGKGLNPDDFRALPIEGLFSFYKNETNVIKMLKETEQNLRRDHPSEVGDRLQDIRESLDAFLDDAGATTSREIIGSSRKDSVVFPKDSADHILKSFQALAPDANKWFRGYDRAMAAWRTATLAFMPRWWINTAVGSVFMSLLSGTLKPKYFLAALRTMHGRGELEAQLMEQAPELRPGVVGAERREASALNDENDKKLHRIADKAYGTVESMESMFKHAVFYHELDKQAKASMHQVNEVIDGYQRVGLSDEYIRNLLENHPDLVHNAVNETNRFMYNFNSLGPIERRWVRRAVPFYGWYKFITKLAYQLPFQYPGRTLALQDLSRIANEYTEKEFGILPISMQGAIFLNNNLSDMHYLPTYGLNPFSDFANPAAPEGTIPGMLSSSQLSPLIGATLTAFGMDPFGGADEISPVEPFLQGRYGNVINEATGEEVPNSVGGVNTGSRFLGSLIRDIPQVNTLATLANGGRYEYPEGIPFLKPRPVPMEAGSAYSSSGGTVPAILRSFVGGIVPKNDNLREDQQQLQEDIEYGESQKKSQLKYLRKAGVR